MPMESGISTTLNPIILRWARERLGLSRRDVQMQSKALGLPYDEIDKAQVTQWEQGQSEPSLADLEALAQIYLCPVGYFFQAEPPKEELALSFRGLSEQKEGSLAPQSQQALRRFLELAEWTTHIIRQLGSEWRVGIETGSAPRSEQDFNNLLEREKERFGFTPAVRDDWRSPKDAFEWWRSRIEGLGVFCFQLKLNPKDIRGASMWLARKYPFILVNHEDAESATGRVFTLLHEYAHLVSQTEGVVCDFRGHQHRRHHEPFANRFAARMLLSTEELGEKLREEGLYHYRARWGDDTLRRIGQNFSVSKDVVLIALTELGLAPEGYYQVKRQQWEKSAPFGRSRSGAGTKNERAFRKLGYSLTSLLANRTADPSLSLTDLAYFTDMKAEKADEFVAWARGAVAECGQLR